MLTKNFLQLQTEIQRHVAADQVAQGSYRTCFIGCLAKQKDSPDLIESEYGIPSAVSRIAEVIFEELPSDEAPAFFAAFPDAVERNGKDLSRVVWQFLAAELRSLPPVEPEVQAAINPVIDGMDLLAQGKEWSEENARAAAWAAVRAANWAANWAAASAADRAASAGDSAARWAAIAAANTADTVNVADWAVNGATKAAILAASTAADAANYLADRIACCRRQRDLLLKLIKEAPKRLIQESGDQELIEAFNQQQQENS